MRVKHRPEIVIPKCGNVTLDVFQYANYSALLLRAPVGTIEFHLNQYTIIREQPIQSKRGFSMAIKVKYCDMEASGFHKTLLTWQLHSFIHNDTATSDRIWLMDQYAVCIKEQ